MRPTLHDYVIEQFEKFDNNSDLFDIDAAFTKCYNLANLTNRAPRLGDFVPCDEFGEVMDGQIESVRYQAAQDRVIFAGDWEVVSDEPWIVIRNKELKIDLEFNDIQCDVTDWDDQWNTCDVFEINRIEELPREIEFKDGVI